MDIINAIKAEIDRLPESRRESPLAVLALMTAEYLAARPGQRDFSSLIRTMIEILDRLGEMKESGSDPVDDELLAWLMREALNGH